MPWSPIAPPTSFSNLPQIQNPTQQAPDPGTQMNALATGNAQRQLMAQQTQDAATQNAQNQIKLQEMQQDQADMQTFRGFYKQYNGDMGKALDASVNAGVGPNVIQPIRTAIQTWQMEQAKLTVQQRDVGNLNNDGMHELLLPVQKMQEGPAQQAAYNQAMQTGSAKGYQDAGALSAHPYTGQADLDTRVMGLTTTNWMGKDAEQKQAAARQTTADAGKAKEDAELPGQQADAAQKVKAKAASDLVSTTNPADYDARRDQFIGPEKGSPAVFPPSRAVFDQNGKWLDGQQAIVTQSGLTSEQRTAAAQAAAKEPPQPTEAGLAAIATDPTRTQEERDAANAALARLDKSKQAARPVVNVNAIPGVPTAPTTRTGDDYLSTLPSAFAARVKNMASGGEPMPTGRAAMSGPGLQLVNAVYQYDPTFTAQRAQTRKAFGPGTTDGRNIGNLNTAAVHLDQLGDAATALDNETFTPANEVFQKFKGMFGASAPTNFEGLRATASGELANALKGVATDPEIANIKSTIDKANSPKQLADQVNTYLGVLRTKLQTYQERYNQQIPGDNVWSPVLPSAQQVFQKHGVTAAGQNPNPSGGSGYVRTSTGAGGHQIGQTSDGKWHDVKTGAVIQ
jgi:hypothetical protein